ncbi:hypothetical protein [Piscirickettsia salmonis]|uniref:hypothetical protein n=1 Tax=Piscirickettsia salmonis TaxID=1238 RepID=UPI0012BAD3EA|nr:hypothetical protein [Piscirickettsia salmonis]
MKEQLRRRALAQIQSHIRLSLVSAALSLFSSPSSFSLSAPFSYRFSFSYFS